jgi:hypothetical protein
MFCQTCKNQMNNTIHEINMQRKAQELKITTHITFPFTLQHFKVIPMYR